MYRTQPLTLPHHTWHHSPSPALTAHAPPTLAHGALADAARFAGGEARPVASRDAVVVGTSADGVALVERIRVAAGLARADGRGGA
jgi:hypothetical protein